MPEPAGSAALQRLHPLSVLFSAASAATRLLLPGLFVLLVRPGGQTDVWLMILFVPTVVAALAKYASYRYRLDPDELVIREGIVTRNERHVPYSRVQNIDLVQNPLQRWLGVAEVRVETASGDKPEAVMRVLSLSAVERLREHVFRERVTAETAALAADAGAGSPSKVLVRTGLRDLVLVGLTSHRGLAVVAAALGLLWQLDPLDDVDERWLETRLSHLELAIPGPLATVLLASAAALALLALLTLLSIAWAIVRYHGFTLRARGEDLRVEYGLFTRVSATIPKHRIQLLSLRRGPIHRLAGRTAVLIETAGHGGGEKGRAADRLWLAPMSGERELTSLLRAVLADVDLETLEWRGLAAGARRRIARRGLVLAAIFAAGAVPVFGPWGLLVLPAGAVLAWFHAARYVEHAGWALAPEAVVYRSGWWTRRTSVVRYSKIQVLALGESPFDRRRRMATLQVDTAGAGRVGHAMDMRYLDAAAAAATLDRLAQETRVRPFRW